ncbi:MAG: V-type ATPase subunit [Planctomycetes bacterium]|nr:V-type ATPase subunit [Planctomycetota bacterium]
MTTATQNEISFYRNPPIGVEDWRYAYQTARVRVLELSMIPRGTFVDMANADSFAEAAELLAGTDYTVGANADSAQIEQMLSECRTRVRQLFAELMLDTEIVDFLRAREDFTNMRLAIRRMVTEKPLGLDYSNEGNVPAEEFEEIFEQENYDRFPDYLQDAVEAAVLGYYEHKDIRQIDYQIDRQEAAWRVRQAAQHKLTFVLSLVRVRIDLANIRTMFRLKMAGREEETNLFLPDGFVDISKFLQGLEAGHEAIGQLFYATPYFELMEAAIPYLRNEQSFLKLEKECEDFVKGFLKTTRSIASGPQPVVAYFLMKEAEIRNVRMALNGKKNGLGAKLILDRLGEWM